jgi:elongation factor P
MKINGNSIKPGNIIEHQGRLWRAVKTQHTQPGKGGAYLQVELKDIRDGTKLNERFRSSETVEKVRLDEHPTSSCSPPTTNTPSWSRRRSSRSPSTAT